MKVLFVNRHDVVGGAAKAAYRMHRSLIENGVDSRMLVLTKTSDDHTVIPAISSGKQQIWMKFIAKMDNLFLRKYPKRIDTYFSQNKYTFNNLAKQINALHPDIVHLNWINGAMLKIEEIKKIKAPVVWSMQDMWAFTGGCHYTDGCLGYKEQCGNCHLLNSSKRGDTSRKIYQRKAKTFTKKDLVIIGPSEWMSNCAKESSLFKHSKHVQLPNLIDTRRYKSYSKETCRDLWNLPQDKKLVFFGAMSASTDKRKGYDLLCKALNKIQTPDVEFIVFGASEPKTPENFPVKVHYMGRLHDDEAMVSLYNTADVVIVPSREENLANFVIECLACAIPVIGFNIGGNSDMIDHKENGYLVKPFDIDDLAHGIDWVLQNSDYLKLTENARSKVEKKFDCKIVTKQYIKLYKQILEDRDKLSI